MTTTTENTPLDLAHLLLKEGRNFDDIQEQLHTMALDTASVEEFMNERYAVQRKKGLSLIAVGVTICVTGCLATLAIGELSAAFHFCLYGLSSLGAITIVGGLALILG